MAVMDEFREEREALKHGTPKQKLQYFWCYYKWHTIIAVLAVIFLVSFIHEVVTRKDTAFYGIFLNSWAKEDTVADFESGFMEKACIDPDAYEINLDTSLYITDDAMDENSYASIQKMTVYVASGEIDVLVSDASSINRYAYNETLGDLRDFLTEEQLQKYEPYFFYVDGAVVKEQQEASDNLDTEYTPVYPDPSKPEEMEDPIPVGLFVGNCKTLTDAYSFRSKDVVAGIVINTNRKQAALDFIDYLFSENP